jgi:hypothetical protein
MQCIRLTNMVLSYIMYTYIKKQLKHIKKFIFKYDIYKLI